jgi:hypothetical protein
MFDNWKLSPPDESGCIEQTFNISFSIELGDINRSEDVLSSVTRYLDNVKCNYVETDEDFWVLEVGGEYTTNINDEFDDKFVKEEATALIESHEHMRRFGIKCENVKLDY